MPTATFFRLPAEKQKRIFRAAVKEFGHSHYSEASINQIIKNAGIPRGSFYQYFEGKEDIFIYVLEEISREKLEVFAQAIEGAKEKGFFASVGAVMPAIIAWVEQRAEYNMIGLRMVEEDSKIARDWFEQMRGSAGAIRMMIENDQKNGWIRGDVTPELVTELASSLAFPLVRLYYQSEDKSEVVKKLVLYFDMLYRGLRNDAAPEGLS
ncbi:MAG: TetR/AcrR family transcriptional regulator [Peptococcaceae bacterium]|nr:TetR/AcrR family transcriptional regulator [Peptococcaceae bacterium]